MAKKLLNRKRINPSSPVFTGNILSESLSLQLFEYNKEKCIEDSSFQGKEFKGFSNVSNNNFWLNVHGIHNSEMIKNICLNVGAHDLLIQDVLDINQRPKFQEYEKHSFFTLKTTIPSKDTTMVQEQMSFIIGTNYLISFQERVADYFEHIRERLRKDIGIVRSRGSDYLLFLLLEAILDNYFKTLYEIENKIEKLGLTGIEANSSPDSLKDIEQLKREIHQIKRTIIPLKDFVIKIEREHSSFVQKKHIKYFLELKDLCLSLIDDCEQHELHLESSTNLFFSLQGHRMNQVMKTLTIVATIFIPLTFIAGIYGMNFSNMPELSWKWGYLGVWILMTIILGGMLLYFKRKKWF